MEYLTAVFILHFGLLVESSVPLTLPDGSGNYAGLCPYREFCTSTALQNMTDPSKTSCCQKCSCLPTCYEVGSCCPDMPDVGNKEPKYACQDITVFQPKNTYAMRGTTRISFRVVDDCPNKILSEKYPRCLNATHLKVFIFVSDLTNERIYRNYHCAECNGVTDVIHWHVSVSGCDDLFFRPFESLDERDEYIVGHCNVLPLQPEAEIGAMSRCIDNDTLLVHKYCNLPTANDTFKHLCEKKIPSTNTLFSEYTVIRQQLYPNIFCYFCNSRGRDIQIDSGCVLSKYSLPTKSARVAFTGLLSLDEMFSSENDDHSNLHVFNYSSIWDPFAKRCRARYSPLGTIPAGKRCVPVVQSESGIVFGLYFIIEIETGFLNRSKKIADIVDNFLQEKMHENGLYCDLCNRPFFRLKNMNDSNLFTEFRLHSSEVCLSRDILTWGRFMLSKGTMGIEIEDEGDVYEVNLKLSAEPAMGKKECEFIKYFYDDICTNGVQLIDWMFLDCPFFRVSAQSLNNFGLVNLDLNYRNNTRAMQIYNSSDVAVCVKDYFNFYHLSRVKLNPKFTLNSFCLYCIFQIFKI